MLTQAAEKLGVTEQALANALNVTTNTPVSLKSAAGQLGVTQQQLMDALGLPSRVTVTSGNTGIFADISNVTVLTHAAEKLGVSEQTLADALNINTPTGKTTDLNSAAKQSWHHPAAISRCTWVYCSACIRQGSHTVWNCGIQWRRTRCHAFFRTIDAGEGA